MKRLFALLLAGVLAFGMAACTQQTTPPAIETAPGEQMNGGDAQAAVKGVFPGTPESDMVVLDITTEPANLNTMMVSDQISLTILQHSMAGLVRLDENAAPVADLADSWEISDDKTVYTLKLRQDAKWSNGDPVTANDFYYAWMWQLDPANAAVGAYFLYENVKGAQDYYDKKADASQLGLKVVDDYTLEIEWNRPMTDGLAYLALPAYMPMNQKAFEEIGPEQYALEADKFVTNGAYKITEWVHDDHITLEKSDTYYNPDIVTVPKIKMVMIGDPTARLNAFMAGELDLTTLYSEQIEQIKSQSESSVQSYFDGGAYWLGFNMINEKLTNKNLRKALAYSIDTQSLLDHVIADGSVAADGLIPHVIAGEGGTKYADARGSLFAYDPEAAKGYLEQALSELNLTAADLNLALSVHDSTYSQNQAAYIQQQWKSNLGLDVEIRVLPYKALYESKLAGDYDLSIEAYGPDINDAAAYLQGFVTNNGTNLGKYSNPQYDQMIESAKLESDPAKRQDMIIAAEKVLIEDMAIGPMYFTCTTYAISDKLTGLVRSPFQMFSLINGAKIS